jgi:Sec-independent protein secretion pathway component TatC
MMKKFIQDAVKRAQRFGFRDYSIFKVALFVCGLWFATIVPAVITVNPRIYGIIWIAG